jgi:hypothetical protein
MTDQQVDLRFVRDNFGHASIATTSAYLHREEDARHAATQERHRIAWTSKTSATRAVSQKHFRTDRGRLRD